MVFDHLVPDLDFSSFKATSWSKFIYGDVEEEVLLQPKPKGYSVYMVCFVSASHVGKLATRRSDTRIIIYLNNSPISWHSKK